MTRPALAPGARRQRVDITLPAAMVAWLAAMTKGRSSRSAVIEDALRPAFEASLEKGETGLDAPASGV